MERILAIGLAGALGALSRYGLQSLVNEVAGRPSIAGTLIANLTGAFLLGLIVAATEDRLALSSVTRAEGTTAPDGSATVPRTSVDVVCAPAGATARKAQQTAVKLRDLIMPIHPQETFNSDGGILSGGGWLSRKNVKSCGLAR